VLLISSYHSHSSGSKLLETTHLSYDMGSSEHLILYTDTDRREEEWRDEFHSNDRSETAGVGHGVSSKDFTNCLGESRRGE
jgi:hypothetical protein